MNEYLKPVFEILLRSLGKARVDYWVYGGVGIAACAGMFIRENKDVDIFVIDGYFERAKAVLNDLCKQNGFKFKPGSQKKGDRPKVEVEIDGIERFSMIPVYQKGEVVVFKYKDGDQEYPNQILERLGRNKSDCVFFTPRDEFIKGDGYKTLFLV